MLLTNLPHVDSDSALDDVLTNNENVMLCCGRMGPMCLPVYDLMEQCKDDYPNVAFVDMDFDGPAASAIRRLPAVRSFTSLPFTLYFHKGQLVEATSSIQTKDQVTDILDRVFGAES